MHPQRQDESTEPLGRGRLREDHLDVRNLRRGLVRRHLDGHDRPRPSSGQDGGIREQLTVRAQGVSRGHAVLPKPASELRHHARIVSLRRGSQVHRQPGCVVAPTLLAVLPAMPGFRRPRRESFAAEPVRAVRPDDDIRLRQRQTRRPLRIPLQLLGRQRPGAGSFRELRLDLLVHRPRLVPELDLQRLRVALAPRSLQLLLLAPQLQLDNRVRHLHLATNLAHLVVASRVVLPAPAGLRPVGLLALAEDVERVGVAGRGGRLQPAQARLPRLRSFIRPVLVHSLQDGGAAADVRQQLQRLFLGQRGGARHLHAPVLVRHDLPPFRRRHRALRHPSLVRLAARNLELPDHQLELLRG
mmetsp:Transcript_7240/g.28484  ORF Transcript_7240/g.28484 Transcript_7240/m.28484 type:complete len:357 (+) Transcript_7240:843-1913(+)